MAARRANVSTKQTPRRPYPIISQRGWSWQALALSPHTQSASSLCGEKTTCSKQRAGNVSPSSFRIIRTPATFEPQLRQLRSYYVRSSPQSVCVWHAQTRPAKPSHPAAAERGGAAARWSPAREEIPANSHPVRHTNAPCKRGHWRGSLELIIHSLYYIYFSDGGGRAV